MSCRTVRFSHRLVEAALRLCRTAYMVSVGYMDPGNGRRTWPRCAIRLSAHLGAPNEQRDGRPSQTLSAGWGLLRTRPCSGCRDAYRRLSDTSCLFYVKSRSARAISLNCWHGIGLISIGIPLKWAVIVTASDVLVRWPCSTRRSQAGGVIVALTRHWCLVIELFLCKHRNRHAGASFHSCRATRSRGDCIGT